MEASRITAVKRGECECDCDVLQMTSKGLEKCKVHGAPRAINAASELAARWVALEAGPEVYCIYAG